MSGSGNSSILPMSGVKRRTPYRKHITHDMMNESPELDDATIVAQIIRAHGTNLFEVIDYHGNGGLCMLPTKFRKLVWVRKGEYVLVSKSDGDVSTAAGTKGSVTYMIERPILREHVKELVRLGTWPESFATEFKGPEEASVAVGGGGSAGGGSIRGRVAASGAGEDDDRPAGAAAAPGKHEGLVDLGGLAMGMGSDLGLTEEGQGGAGGVAGSEGAGDYAGRAAGGYGGYGEDGDAEESEDEEDDLDF